MTGGPSRPARYLKIWELSWEGALAKRRRLPPHLLPFDDPRFRPLAISDLRQLPASDRRRFLRALRKLQVGELIWGERRRGAEFKAWARHQAELEKALGLTRSRPKRRTGNPAGRPRKVKTSTVRALKRLGRTDDQIAEVFRVSRSTIARRK